MWRRSGRSSAMDRAQVVLSVRRTGGGGGGATQGSVGLSVNALLSDPSDPTSVSSAPGHGDDDIMSENSPGTERRTNKDLRPQSSLGGGGAGGRGGSRFLKKAPPPTNSSQSPVNRNQMQHPEPRYVTSSQRGCRTAALSRLAEIENRFLGRMQNPDRTGQVTKPALGLTSDPGVSAPAADSRTPEAPVKLPAPSGGARSPRGGRFLKNKAAGADRSSEAAPDRTDVGVGSGSGSRAADPVVPSVRAVSGVSLESDEEDMRKLLGDSADSNDCSFFRPARPSSTKETDQKLSRSSRRLPSSPHPPPAAVPPPSPSTTAPPRSTVSPPPPRCSSPFRFTGQARARFSPSVLSSSPSLPPVSPSPPPERPGSSHRTDSPAVSSVSGHGEVLSLEELFPVGPGSEGPHSEMSSVSCEDFKMNVMTLDDLVPAGFGLTAEKQKELKPSMPIHTSPTRHQQLPEEEEEEEVLDYQSDFESESRTEPGYSASQVSEHLQEKEEEEEVVSEVREEVLLSEGSRRRRRTKDDYSSAFSEKCSCASRMSDGRWRSKSFSRSRDSRSESPGSWTSSSSSSSSSQESRKRVPARKALKEAAVQTQPDPLAYTWSAGVAALRTYMTPAAVVSHTVSAEMIEAISSSNTAAFTLTEMLKQQVAMTTHFIERNRHLHCSLLQSLEPPNYRYTTLEDTQQKICMNRCPGLTVEEALQEALQEHVTTHEVN